MIAIRHICTVAACALLLVGCATAEREDDTPDRGVDELATIPQLAHDNVCGNSGKWHCKARVRVNNSHAIMPFATPQGLGPADLISAYKINTANGANATIAIVDAF